MKCPVCEYDVPSSLSACTRCGALLPLAGERPGPEPRFSSGALGSPQAGSPNPKTEPLQLPVWDAGEKRPWDAPQDPYTAPETDATPPEPESPTQILGAPETHPRPLEYDPAPMSPEHHRARRDLGAPWPGPMPAGDEAATQNPGAPWAGPVPPPGHDPAGWDQGLPPVAGETAGGHAGKGRKTPLLVGGIVAVAVLAGGLVYALTQGSSGSGHQTPASGGRPGAGGAVQQAAAVDQILKSGKTARGHLPSRLRTCDDVAAGVAGFEQVVQDRQQELSQARGLKVDRLQDGSRLRQAMIAAYQSSLDADQAYLAWAREIQARGCGGKIAPMTAHYKDAIAANDKAGPAKRQVIALWRPIASSHGLPTYAWNRL